MSDHPNPPATPDVPELVGRIDALYETATRAPLWDDRNNADFDLCSALVNAWPDIKSELSRLSRELAEAKEARAGAEKDAERYRWLRENCWIEGDFDQQPNMLHFVPDDGNAELDAAIDSLRSSSGCEG